jgi:enediyne biosynthesis protein E4
LPLDEHGFNDDAYATKHSHMDSPHGGVRRSRAGEFVFRNLGNSKFEELTEEAGPAVSAAHCSRGCALGDFDNDGDVDMVIINLNEPPSLLRNDVTGNRKWIKVLLVGTQSNRSALGSRVLLKYGGKVQA